MNASAATCGTTSRSPCRSFVLRTATETERMAQTFDLSSSAVAEQGLDDHILLAVDQPADQWLGVITHELAHVFGFDILPSKSIATWIREGLAEYERGTWDPNDLVVLRNAVRSNAVPAMSRLQGDRRQRAPPRVLTRPRRLRFRGITSRARTGCASSCSRSERPPTPAPIRSRLRCRWIATHSIARSKPTCGSALPLPPASRRAPAATSVPVLRVEGEVTAIRWPVAEGLACFELWVPIGDGVRSSALGHRMRHRRRHRTSQRHSSPVTTLSSPAPSHDGMTAHRLTLASLARPADGFIWRADI